MKKIILPTSLLLIITSLVLIFNINPQSDKPEKINYFSQSLEGDISNRLDYEFEKTKDPRSGSLPQNYRAREIQTAKSILKKKNQFKSKADIWEKPWSFSGPKNVGGRTRALSYDIRNENILLAGGVSSGVFRSENAGLNWTRAESNAPQHSLSYIMQDTLEGNQDVWYYATGEKLGNSANGSSEVEALSLSPYRGSGIYKSYDNGQSWKRLEATAPSNPNENSSNFQYVYKIAKDYSVNDADVIYAACVGAIMRSEDGGESWETAFGLFQKDMSEATDIYIHTDGTKYISLSSTAANGGTSPLYGFYKSQDGLNWEEIKPTNFTQSFGRTVIHATNKDMNQVYFLSYTKNDGQNEHSFFVYFPEDNSWTDITPNLPNQEPIVFDSQRGYDLCITSYPENPDYIIIGGTSLFLSKTGFFGNDSKTIGGYDINYSPIPIIPGSWVDYHQLVFSKENPKKLFVGSDGGVRYITDIEAENLEWNELNISYNTSQFYGVAIDKALDSDSIFILGGMQDRGAFSSYIEQKASEWKDLKVLGDGGITQVASGGLSYYYSTQGGFITQVKLLKDQEPIKTNVTPFDAAPYLFITPYKLDPNNNNLMFYGDSKNLWRNTRIEETKPGEDLWTKLDNALTEDAISAIGISQLPANIVYYGTTEGDLARLDNSLAADPIAVDITSAIFPENGYINDIIVDPKDGEKLMVCFSNYNVKSIFYSEDKGAHWQHIGGNLDDEDNFGPSIRCGQIVYDKDNKPLYLIGSSIGIFLTSDLNADEIIWEPQALDVVGNALVIDFESRADGIIVAATHGNGIYQAQITSPLSLDPQIIKRQFQASVFPNPIKGNSFNINIEMEENASIEAYLINSRGQRIGHLQNHDLTKGINKVEFHCAHINPGSYILQIQCADYKKSFPIVK